MKQINWFSFLLLVLIGIAFNSYAQQPTLPPSAATQAAQYIASAQQAAVGQHEWLRNHYQVILEVDSSKAEQVALIQDNYKLELRNAMTDTTMNIVARRAKVKLLVAAKNQQLQRLLTLEQQKKIIPVTEREPQ